MFLNVALYFKAIITSVMN